MKARQFRCGWVIAALMMMTQAAPAMPETAVVSDDHEQQREIFRQGWAAARRGDQAGIMRAKAALHDYPLTPYLEFEILRQRLDSVPPVVMEQFLARYRDWSFAGSLETAWLRSLGRQRQWDDVLLHAAGSSDLEVRCHLARARVERQQHAGLEADIQTLWLAGHSLPEACDQAFAWWRRQGNPANDIAWQRFRLAIDGGEVDLARYLRRYLDRDQRYLADLWLSMRTRPHVTLRQARQWQDHAALRTLIGAGIRQLARSDWERAWQHWNSLEPRFAWNESERAPIARELALFRAVALDEQAVAVIDALPDAARDQQLLEWRARAAMARDDWPAVLESIHAMSVAEQARPRWRYWRGRALAAMNRPDALIAFASLSAEANYYGFLSAARLGQDFSLCNENLATEVAVQNRLLRDAEFERAMELFHVGLYSHGRWTWARVSRRLSRSELEQAALMAARAGWHDRSIAALNSAGNRQAYSWRFPMAEKGKVMALSDHYQVPPALVYGLMRAESAMQNDALSPAGARGLLQLMPTTAEAVAGRNGLAFNGRADLMEPAVNIPLGIAHLAELQKRYQGDWVRVAAAYNAGINAVARWLDTRPHSEPDVWMETMPFFETRDYVPRVLAFATIYEWQLGQSASVLARHALGREGENATFACPP